MVVLSVMLVFGSVYLFTSNNKSIGELVGGFNPKWETSPSKGENTKYLSCHHLGNYGEL